MRGLLPIALLVALTSVPAPVWAGKPGEGVLELSITDRDTGKPLPCRIHLKNAAGVARKVNKLPFWHDHFVCPGNVTLVLPKGNYTFTIEHGPEFADRGGYFTITDYAQDQKVVDLKRAVNMVEENWWAGDLHAHRSAREIELLMQADELNVVPLVTWSNKKNEWPTDRKPADYITLFDEHRYYDVTAGEDTRACGSLLFLRLNSAIELPAANDTATSSVDLINRAKAQPNAWIDVVDPTSWDLPLWLATGKIDSIELINDDILRGPMKIPTSGRARPRSSEDKRKPDPREHATWLQEIYFHILNCGLRIPPSAGSGSGVSINPLGYNRTYVWVDKDQLDYEAWWEGLAEGRVTVTNGPLVRPFANGRIPGHVFKLIEGEKLEVDVAMNLATRDKISYLEVIKNGRAVQSIRLEDWARTGHFPPFACDESGWFLVRVICDMPDSCRYALSGPWYVEAARRPTRVSRRSVQFFLDWLAQRAAQLKDTPSYAADLTTARTFWEDLLAKANAD